MRILEIYENLSTEGTLDFACFAKLIEQTSVIF